MTDIADEFSMSKYASTAQRGMALLDEIERLRARVAELEVVLRNIVAADWRGWHELASPDEFVRWAKSRANHALATSNAAMKEHHD